MIINMTLGEYLNKLNIYELEGYSQEVPEQVHRLAMLIFEKKPAHMMEIGFNAGHSAEVMLTVQPTAHMVSFDLGIHSYTQWGKTYIDQKFPFHHILCLGDSRHSVPEFHQMYPSVRFDVIFIDGGHHYEQAKQDLMNCRAFAHDDTLVIVDDTVYGYENPAEYTVGPTKAWLEGCQNGIITELGRDVYSADRGMSWGKYILPTNS